MKVDLDKNDLISMVMGKDPGFSLLNEDLVKRGGYFTGGFVDKWAWEKHKLQSFSDEELFELHKMLKESGYSIGLR